MIIIDGKGSILGRVASYAAKQALKGEEIAILNCEDILISGNRNFIVNEFNPLHWNWFSRSLYVLTLVGLITYAIREYKQK